MVGCTHGNVNLRIVNSAMLLVTINIYKTLSSYIRVNALLLSSDL